MASPSELSLDCKPHSYSMLLKSFGDQTLQPSSDQSQTHKLEDFLARLEEERLKIDAFKRELPLCMQLLTNAVETSRQQLQAFRGSVGQEARHAVLEEFIPLTLSSSEASEKATSFSDKTTWMTSAQLWSQSGDVNHVITKQQSSPTHKDQTDIGFSPKLALDHKQRNGGAFLPFSKERNLSSISSPNQAIRALPDLALNSSEDHKVMEDRKQCSEKGNNGGVVIDQAKSTAGNNSSSENLATANNVNTNNSSTNQTNRKARRCWSPDLHRRFVNALQMLGGSQVATPKQIRELMKVDGLTNDEVKSHLQKYRLHTRRPSPSPQATGGPAPQLVVLGGIWVPSEYATAAAAAAAHHSAGTPTLYASAHAPTHYCAPPQDHYYAAAAANQAPPPQIHHHTLHHQLHVYNNKSTASQTHSSPESELRGGEDRSESIEDGKSESGSWKGDSGGGERKGLAALREDGEESNGSDITLKF